MLAAHCLFVRALLITLAGEKKWNISFSRWQPNYVRSLSIWLDTMWVRVHINYLYTFSDPPRSSSMSSFSFSSGGLAGPAADGSQTTRRRHGPRYATVVSTPTATSCLHFRVTTDLSHIPGSANVSRPLPPRYCMCPRKATGPVRSAPVDLNNLGRPPNRPLPPKRSPSISRSCPLRSFRALRRGDALVGSFTQRKLGAAVVLGDVSTSVFRPLLPAKFRSAFCSVTY